MSSSHPILKHLTRSLNYACATMVGSSLAGFCCVMMAVHLGFDAKAGMAFSMLLLSLNTSMVYRLREFVQDDEKVPLAWRIVGMVIALIVPACFWALGVYSAFVMFV